MTCELARSRLSLFLYGELSFDEEEALQQHLESCEGCRHALEREKVWHEAVDLHATEPPANLLAQFRQDLRARLAEERRPHRTFALWEWLGEVLNAPYMRPIGALALVLAGFFAARLTAPGVSPVSQADNAGRGPTATQVRYVQPDAAGGVRIVMDETRQRILSGSLEDQDIQRLLLAAASDGADPGLRVESMDILKSGADSSEIRQVLLQALRQDPVAGVRLKAIEGLKSFAAEPEVRKVLSEVLLADENPGVRTQAIDLLVQHKGEGMAGLLQEALYRDNNEYVRLRCQKALREMNASVGTF